MVVRHGSFAPGRSCIVSRPHADRSSTQRDERSRPEELLLEIYSLETVACAYVRMYSPLSAPAHMRMIIVIDTYLGVLGDYRVQVSEAT